MKALLILVVIRVYPIDLHAEKATEIYIYVYIYIYIWFGKRAIEQEGVWKHSHDRKNNVGLISDRRESHRRDHDH